MSELDRQAVVDDEHLRLLQVGYFLSSGIAALVALYLALRLGMAVLLGGAAIIPLGMSFILVPSAAVALATVVAVLRFQTALNLGRRISRTRCLMVGVLSCVELPYGTVLGILTFFVLSRPSVRRLFTDFGKLEE